MIQAYNVELTIAEKIILQLEVAGQLRQIRVWLGWIIEQLGQIRECTRHNLAQLCLIFCVFPSSDAGI